MGESNPFSLDFGPGKLSVRSPTPRYVDAQDCHDPFGAFPWRVLDLHAGSYILPRYRWRWRARLLAAWLNWRDRE